MNKLTKISIGSSDFQGFECMSAFIHSNDLNNYTCVQMTIEISGPITPWHSTSRSHNTFSKCFPITLPQQIPKMNSNFPYFSWNLFSSIHQLPEYVCFSLYYMLVECKTCVFLFILPLLYTQHQIIEKMNEHFKW